MTESRSGKAFSLARSSGDPQNTSEGNNRNSEKAGRAERVDRAVRATRINAAIAG
jgi:hypothetical protein